MSAKKKVVKEVSSLVIHMAMAVILLTAAAMVFYVGAKKAYSFGYDIFGEQSVAAAPGTDKLFVVEEDTSRMQCMDNLEKSGLIRSKMVALIQSYFFEYEIYPGTYTLNTSMTTKEILIELNEEPSEPLPIETKKAAAPVTETEAVTKEVIEGDE